ncbi:MAG: sugar phosphate isomerase/epimerase [Verrucomicrobiota bacterium]
MYSFSSCWNSHRHTDGREMLREIRTLGFDRAELSHGIRISLLPGIFQAVEAGEIKISTLHNFCPLPMGVTKAAPNLYLFSSPDERERENAFRHSVKTIETAARLQAQAVVLHLGQIEMKEYTDKLLGLVGDGKKETAKFEKVCAEAIETRENKKEKFVAQSNEMLRRLIEVAKPLGIKLGVENREAVEEIPLELDFSRLFREFPDDTVGYWHDTGHAQIKENLGFIYHHLHLESMSPRLLGFHIHDVEFPGRDHRAPGSGMIDFTALKPMVKPEHIKVFEFSPSLTVEAAQRGIAHIKNLWGND